MKEKKEKKLRLGKMTIQNLDSILDRDEQKVIKGGSENNPPGTTDLAIFC